MSTFMHGLGTSVFAREGSSSHETPSGVVDPIDSDSAARRVVGWSGNRVTRTALQYLLLLATLMLAPSCGTDSNITNAPLVTTVAFAEGTPTSVPMQSQVAVQVNVRDEAGNPLRSPSVTWTPSN